MIYTCLLQMLWWEENKGNEFWFADKIDDGSNGDVADDQYHLFQV